jgi:hypothetical protein
MCRLVFDIAEGSLFPQQEASSSGIPPWRTYNISQHGSAEKITGGGDSPVVRNLPLLLIEVISPTASSSGIPSQGASSSSSPVDWELVYLAYHHTAADSQTKMVYNL